MNPALKARKRLAREIGISGAWGAPKRSSPPTSISDKPAVVSEISVADETLKSDLLAGLHYTQQGFADLFVRLHGNIVRYCHDSRVWRIWDGTRWKRDETEEVYRLSMKTIRVIHEIADTWETKTNNDRELQVQIKNWARRCETRRWMDESLKIVRTNESIAVTDNYFDNDPYVLNLQNGTLDLRTGNLRKYRREDYLTMLAPVPFNWSAKCPNWELFIRMVTGGDADLIQFLRRVVGYVLTEDPKEEVFYLFYGPPRSGKTTFLEVIRALMGDYARQADFSTFLATKFISPNSPRSDLTRLSRARLVTASEAESGQRWAEGLIKRLTGRDTVTARALYRESQEYRPGFKLCFALNDLPDVRPEEEAFWRRTVVIPFSYQVPEEMVDKNLRETLLSELPGILAWAVRGCLDWQKYSFTIPSVIQEATNKYREETDTIKQYIDEWCYVGVGESELSTDIYRSYFAWCKSLNIECVSQKSFTQYLVGKLGCQKKREPGTGRSLIVGIRLHTTRLRT